jgi:NAD dependent epimerase/dehydratase
MTTSLKGKTVLVTGAGGFIGSHLTERLVELGAETRAFVRYTSSGSRGWLGASPLVKNIRFFHGDIRDHSLVEKAVKGCDVVLHLAALIGIPYSYDAPDSYVQTNVTGTLNVLQACRAHSVGRLVNTSTSEVYGTAQFTPITEKHPLQGQSPYSATKIGADKLVESFWRSFELDAVTARPFNTFGPRQSARAVIPTIISQLLAGAKKIRLGNLEARRDLNYVANTVDAFVACAATPGLAGETIHFGSGREVSIGELFAIIRGLTGSDAEVEIDAARIRPEKSEVGLLLADNTNAQKLLAWSPKVTLEEGLGHVVAWVKDHLHTFRTDEYAV